MSVQISKTPNDTSAPARRTPLSLNTSGGNKSVKVQLTEIIDLDKETSTNDGSSTDLNKTAPKNEKTDNNSTDSRKSNENSKKPTIGTGSNSAKDKDKEKDKSGDDNKKKDNKKQKDKDKEKEKEKEKEKDKDKEEKKHENGVDEVKPEKVNAAKSEDTKKPSVVNKNDVKSPVRESARQKAAKEVKDTKDKEDKQLGASEKRKSDTKTEKIQEKRKSIEVKTDEIKEKQDKKIGNERQEKVEKPIDKEDEEMKKENEAKPQSEPEQLNIKQKDNKESGEYCEEVVVSSSKQSARGNDEGSAPIMSYQQENELNGYSDGEEMESLVYEPEMDSKGPSETSTPGKMLNQKATISIKDIEQKKDNREKLECKKIYTRDESEESDNAYSASASSTLERPYYVSPLRAITGRRSLRPMKEYSFQSQYRESYRKINTELDYTSSSVNVTVGSDISNETFSFFGRGKKRERTPPLLSSSSSNIRNAGENRADIELSPKSPKRARLDFSGLFGIVSSPVSMLRAKFSKTKIECSTPEAKLTLRNVNNSKNNNEGVENVSIIATEEMVSETAEDIQPEDYVESVKDVEIDENINTCGDGKKDSKSVVASMESVNKKRMCRIM